MNRKSKMVERWKKYNMDIIRERFGDTISMIKVEEYLDRIIASELKDPTVYVVNNQKRIVSTIDLLALTESIDDQNLLIGGASVLFCQHDQMKNPVRNFILRQRNKRKEEKKDKKRFECK